jgi:hypothetical protein
MTSDVNTAENGFKNTIHDNDTNVIRRNSNISVGEVKYEEKVNRRTKKSCFERLRIYCLKSTDNDDDDREHGLMIKLRKILHKYHYLTEAFVFASNKIL